MFILNQQKIKSASTNLTSSWSITDKEINPSPFANHGADLNLHRFKIPSAKKITLQEYQQRLSAQQQRLSQQQIQDNPPFINEQRLSSIQQKMKEQLQAQSQRQAQVQAQSQRQVQVQAQSQRQAESKNKIQMQLQSNSKNNIKPQLQEQNQPKMPMAPQPQNFNNFQRIITPQYNNIDLHNNLNSTLSKKTIVHVLDFSNGFGDFLRGSILLAEYAKHFNINFKMDVSRHYISEYLHSCTELLSEMQKINSVFYCGNPTSNDNLYSLIKQFVNSYEETFYITTNLFYNIDLLTADIKSNINNFFTFKKEYYNIAKNLFNLDKYNVLHIRCKDDYFDTDFEDNNLLVEIIKLQLPDDTIVISNNYSLKVRLNKLFGFKFIDKKAYHTGKINDYSELESTVIEYIILSGSNQTNCFSYYEHGSGFSEQCSVLNDIPYSVVYLPDTDIMRDSKNETRENINMLLTHYNNLLEGNNAKNIQQTKMENIVHDNISFITLTNTGYVDYTLNCIESLKKMNMKQPLKTYCIGEEGYNILNKNNVLCELISDKNAENFEEFRKNNWSNITYYKFKIIYENLLNSEYVCITDGDIVYENNCIFDYLLNNIEDNDVLIQSEGIGYNDLCSGFMFIKSNENTISIFNPENVEIYKNNVGWDDQIYVNAIKYKLKYKKLPLHLFPTGNYYYTYGEKLMPYLIHFNWIIGHEKKNKMIQYNKWYLSKKIKICQHGTDGFGHQLEGMLRLLSLSLNNKAEYQYNYNKKYKFEHKNFNIDRLKQYLSAALNILSNENVNTNNDFLNIIYREQRTFDEILKSDIDVDNTIYFYDGVSSNIPNQLPPNFEYNNEIEKTLPKLREAFVDKNSYLPEKSYDNSFINVCCHIRLGDAVGQRILDNQNLFKVIKEFQKYNKYRIIIHSDGDVNHLSSDNTIIYDSTVDVLQVLSDFIYSDILIINYSSLSISAQLLTNNKQTIICPTNAGPTFKHRILSKCITTEEFFHK